MKYFVIGDEDTVAGFGLAGVRGRRATDTEEAEAAFESALTTHNAGIIIITERVADLIRPTVERYQFSQQFPLIVEIPARSGKLPGRPGIREMVNRAIGISV